MKLNIKKIRSEMERAGLNQSQLALEAKVTRQAMSWLLKNRRTTFGTLGRIAAVFDLDPKDLLV